MQQPIRVVWGETTAAIREPSPEAPERTEKPWGYEDLMHLERYAVKRLHVNANHRLSLQLHEQKTETLVVLRGTAHILIGEQERNLAAGEVVHVPAGVRHRIAAGPEDVELFEVSTLELDDVVRLDDDYGREDGLEQTAA